MRSLTKYSKDEIKGLINNGFSVFYSWLEIWVKTDPLLKGIEKESKHKRKVKHSFNFNFY